MSAANETIEELFRLGLRPHLLAAGFKGKGRTLIRSFPEVTQVVAVQGSAGNFGGSGRFYVEIGLIIPEVEAALGNVLTRVVLNKTIVTWSWRLPGPWEVGLETDPSETAATLSAAWQKAGTPLTQTAVDLPGCLTALTEHDGYLEATAAAVVLGKADVAEKLLAQLLTKVRPANPRFADIIEKWGASKLAK